MNDYFELLSRVAKKKRGLTPHKKKPNPYVVDGVATERAPIKKKRAKKTPETIITDIISKYLINAKYLVVKINSANLFNTHTQMPMRSYIIRNTGASSGFPDLLAMKNNSVLLIEVKSEKGRLSESQEAFRELCTQHKVRYIVARDVKDIERFIDYNEL